MLRVFMFLIGLVTSGNIAAEAKEAPLMLIEAVAAGDIPAIKAAIVRGAELEQRDDKGRTALLLATHADNLEAAKLLIAAGADVNAKDDIQDTPFLYAGAEGRNEILKAILASGKANLKDTNRFGGTALIPAADHGFPETVAILLETDIDIDHVNDLGWTALMEAVILGDGGAVQQKIVGLLVDAGARDIPDNDGLSALQHARQRGYDEIAQRIAEGVADPRPG
ncbi:ankyrin repeat domain-containing protein [Mesorhizobium retamae]|uniref:Ankyrin repeat domain-containing protein n=1 Tax=Mesorhizobium retamae TaxID=2912854 RepID=A0ABS9QIQ2_9HYPH|nr:ankyrin repeat domain-containing protein [Mesorhizobium sp. IRAMC:0171]MCG7507322.1 ankyrin repeat domain-containing protein [Mesorhizobium sp. IRAMC:0171]